MVEKRICAIFNGSIFIESWFEDIVKGDKFKLYENGKVVKDEKGNELFVAKTSAKYFENRHVSFVEIENTGEILTELEGNSQYKCDGSIEYDCGR